MEIDRELYNLTCIKRMGTDYFHKWERIKEQYAPKLDGKPIYQPIAYTHHDYTHHCYDLYKIVGQIILHEPQLSEQEWFVLNVAILLHDFYMTFPDCNRLIHSKQSAEWLLNEMHNDTVLKQNLNWGEAEAIALIIEAHSDCKKKDDDGEVIEKYTLENEEIQDRMDCDGAYEVQVKFLAAILRIADECDVTRSRMGKDDFDKLDENDEAQRYSKEQWLQLKCFKNLNRSGEDLILVVDDRYINDNGSEKDAIIRRIKNVVLKIRKQLDYVRSKVITTDQYLAMFQLRNVRIYSKALGEEDVKKINSMQLIDEDFPELSIRILDNDLANRISAKIDDDGNEMITSGHYIVTEEHCERDWIDLRDIVVDFELADIIINKIADKISSKYQNNTQLPIIVGMEDNGLILASQIAYRLNYPFTYIIPYNFNLKKSSQKERDIDFSIYDKIIIITDAVATFRTMGITCEKYKIFDKVCDIYTVLYRTPKDKSFFHKDAKRLMKNLTACCSKYDIEVHYRNQCPNNKNGKCKAINK